MKNETRNIEIRFKEDESRQSPGRIHGTLMAYETRAQDRAEVFKPNSLSWPENGIIINEQHSRSQPILRVVPELRGNEVVIDAPLPDTQRGRDAATLIRNGTLTGLSVEFRATQQQHVAGVREIHRALLLGAALVDEGSYPSATVEVRHKGTRRLLWL